RGSNGTLGGDRREYFGQNRRVWPTDHPKESRRHAQRIRREHQKTVNWKIIPESFLGLSRLHLCVCNLFCAFAPKHGCNNLRQASSDPSSCLHIGNSQSSAGWSLCLRSASMRAVSKSEEHQAYRRNNRSSHD